MPEQNLFLMHTNNSYKLDGAIIPLYQFIFHLSIR